MFGLGFQELVIVGMVAVILFGKRLPEVARSLGSSYRDLRRGLSELQSQVDFSDSYYSTTRSSSSYASNYRAEEPDDYDQPTAPRFELPPAATSEASSEPTENPLN
jgi:sec-independent protein translocase protein TatA